jgi:hypothetical protein
MPPWLISGLVSLGVGVVVGLIMFGVNRLTTKSAANLAGEIEQLKKSAFSVEEKITLEHRLTKFETSLANIEDECEFTRDAQRDFLRLLEKAFIPVAHSPHTPELDRLLDKRNEGHDLNSEEWRELIERLGDQAKQYDDAPGKQVSLLGLRAIYLTHLKLAQKREEKERQKQERQDQQHGH